MEVPAPHHLGKVGLRGKLTGPSQLLFGKCKSTHKPRNGGPKDKRLNIPSRGSSNLLSNNCYSVQEEVPQEPSGSTPDPLSSCEESTRLECSPKPWFYSFKPDRDSESKKSKAQESSCLTGWRKYFCHLFLCPRRLKFKSALSNEDLNHGFTYYNQQTRDSVDITNRPSVIYQVIEQDEYRHCTKTEQPFLKGIFYLRKKKLFSSKPNLKGLDPTLVIQEAAPCPCLQLKKQLRHQMRSRAKKPSPFFQERIGGAQEYIHEETIVLSNRHTDEAAYGLYQSTPDDMPLQVSVDVTPVISERESRSCTLHTTDAKSFGETNLLGDQEGAENAVFPEEEILTTETIRTDGSNASIDIAVCHKHEDENEAEEGVNPPLRAVNAPENLLISESSATSQVNQEDKDVLKWNSTVTEDRQATSHLRPTNNLNCEEIVMDIVDQLMSCPDVCHDKHRLDVIPSDGAEPAEDDPRCETSDPKPPEVLLQTARLLVQAAMEGALRQLEEDLVNSVTGYYEETGDC